MKRIVLFGNCQFGHLGYLLSNVLPDDGYKTSYFSNNARTGNPADTQTVLCAMKEADILIYQPLGRDYGPLSQDGIRTLRENIGPCLSMEYVFNSGVYSLCHAPFHADYSYGKTFGEECICSLPREMSKEDILLAYRTGTIDFKLAERFSRCLAEMEERELRSASDIRLAHFIQRRYRQEKLFHTHNHPSNALFREIVRQLSALMYLPVDTLRWDDLNLKELGDLRSPVSPYDVAVHGYSFDASPDWLEAGERLIALIWQRLEGCKAETRT